MDHRPWGGLSRAVGRTFAPDDASAGRRFLELLAVSGLAVAQPILDVLGRSADIFVVRRAGWADVVLLVLLVVLGPALAGSLVELAVGLVSSRARHVVHVVLLGAFAVLFAIQAVKEVTEQGWRRVLVAGVVLGVALVVLVMNVRPVRSWLRVLAVFPVVLGLVFLLSSPAREVVLGGEAAVAEVTVGAPAPVVMIVLDELPISSLLEADGRVDRTHFPAFARLAEESTWYRNHTAVAPVTAEAIPAILTGRWAELGRPSPTAENYPENLFTLLGDRYALHVREAASKLCPDSMCPAPAYGALPDLLRDARDVWTSRARPKPTKDVLDLDLGGGDDTARAAVLTDFTAHLGPSGDTPRLDFVHAVMPHGGWTFLPSGARYAGPHPPTGNVFLTWVDEYAAAAGRQRHLLQLQYTDRLLGEALDRLRELGTYDESLVVVTADHGVSFRAGETLRAPNRQNYPEVMWTPLFIKSPGQESADLVEAPSRAIDVLPTIADHLGIELPWEVDGTSLLRTRRDDAEVRMLASTLGAGAEAEDDHLTFDGEEGYRQALALGGRIPDDPLGVHRIDPYGSLVGTPVTALPVGGRSGMTGRLDDPAAYRRVDPASDELPVYVTGSVRSERHVDVAVAVNGVIAGWCETAASAAPEGEEDKPFWVVVPESLLDAGDNDVSLYQVSGSPGAPELRPIPLD